MSSDELWTLHQEIAVALLTKIATEKAMVEGRLRLLNRDGGKQAKRLRAGITPSSFRNPDEPSQTWPGRGKQPRWLIAQLRSGRAIDDFRIEAAAA